MQELLFDSATFRVPAQLKADLPGVEWLCRVAGQSIAYIGESVFIDFTDCNYIEGNLCAVIGSIIHGMQSRGCTVYFSGHSTDIKRALVNNGFWKAFKPDDAVDHVPDGTAVPFRWFRKDEETAFKDYITAEVFRKMVKLQLSEALRKRMIESVAEIYVNAYAHGFCDLAFCCGQFFRNSQNLSITFVDLGRTIKGNVEEFLAKPYSGIESIEWALAGTNTTKKLHSGGLGLKITKAFIDMNLGRMHIVSANGFWALEQGVYYRHELPLAFPGTVVTLTFDLTDTTQYLLAEEILPDNPF